MKLIFLVKPPSLLPKSIIHLIFEEEEDDTVHTQRSVILSMDDDVDLPAGEPAEQPASRLTSSSLASRHVVQFQLQNGQNPIWRLSPSWHNGAGSALYDFYELKAMTHLLNKAIHHQAFAAPAGSSPPYVSHLQSPFCRQRLGGICKQNTKTQKRISGGRAAAINDRINNNNNPSGGRASATARGFVSRLWKKIKQGIFKSKQKNDGGGDQRPAFSNFPHSSVI